MTNTNLYTETVKSLLKQAEIDFKIRKCFGEIIEDDFIEGELDPSLTEVLPITKYIRDNHLFHIGDISTRNLYGSTLVGILTTLSDNGISCSTIKFRQCYNPYMFKVYNEYFTTFLPLVLTRAFMHLLRLYGVKCEVEKRDKSLCNELNAYLTDLVFTGKSDINIPEFKLIEKACKAIKGKINPWSKEEEVKEDSTELYSEANLRFRGAEWFNVAQRPVTLIGAGGISSNIAVSLCRVLGNNILTIYDPDTIEHKNLAGQNFGTSDIGLYKATVVGEQCINFNPSLHITPVCSRFSEKDSVSNITITGLDNMATRSLVFSKWMGLMSDKKDEDKHRLLIDARLSAEKWQIFCITGDNKAAQKEYEDKWLFTDDEADSDVCSYKQTAYAAQMCASFVTNLYINFCTNLIKDDNDPLRRYLPFMTEYDASQMILRYKEI